MISAVPSEEEYEIVRKYVMERPLIRPSITYKKALMNIFVFLVAFIMTSISLSLLGQFLFCNSEIEILKQIKFWIFVSLIIFLFITFFIRKKIVIGMIHLYQHYAPEDVRRRCLLKPTCSEYAIQAITKYGIIIGFIKIWIRLKYKCRGNVYYIDELR